MDDNCQWSPFGSLWRPIRHSKQRSPLMAVIIVDVVLILDWRVEKSCDQFSAVHWISLPQWTATQRTHSDSNGLTIVWSADCAHNKTTLRADNTFHILQIDSNFPKHRMFSLFDTLTLDSNPVKYYSTADRSLALSLNWNLCLVSIGISKTEWHSIQSLAINQS